MEAAVEAAAVEVEAAGGGHAEHDRHPCLRGGGELRRGRLRR